MARVGAISLLGNCSTSYVVKLVKSSLNKNVRLLIDNCIVNKTQKCIWDVADYTIQYWQNNIYCKLQRERYHEIRTYYFDVSFLVTHFDIQTSIWTDQTNFNITINHGRDTYHYNSTTQRLMVVKNGELASTKIIVITDPFAAITHLDREYRLCQTPQF